MDVEMAERVSKGRFEEALDILLMAQAHKDVMEFDRSIEHSMASLCKSTRNIVDRQRRRIVVSHKGNRSRHLYLKDILERCGDLRELVFNDSLLPVSPREALLLSERCHLLETVCGFVDISGAHLLANRLKHMSVMVPKFCGKTRFDRIEGCKTSSITLSVNHPTTVSQWRAAAQFLERVPTLTDLCLNSDESVDMHTVLSIVPPGVTTLGIYGKMQLKSSSIWPLWDVRVLALDGDFLSAPEGMYFQHIMFAVPKLQELRVYSKDVVKVVSLPIELKSIVAQRPLSAMLVCPAMESLVLMEAPNWQEMIDMSRCFPRLKNLKILDRATRHCNIMNSISVYVGLFPRIETLEISVPNNCYVGSFDNIKHLNLTCKYAIFGNQDNSIVKLNMYEGKACATGDTCSFGKLTEIHLGHKGSASFDFIKCCPNLELLTIVRGCDYGDHETIREKLKDDIRYYCLARDYDVYKAKIEVPPNPKGETVTVGISFAKTLAAVCFFFGGHPYTGPIVIQKYVAPAPAEE